MSLKSAKAFAERVKWDADLRKSITQAEDKIAVVKEAGFDFTVEEWHQARQQAIAKATADGELSEGELKKVAGGGLPWEHDWNWCWG